MEKWVLREIFVLTRDKVTGTGKWRHEEVKDLYCSPNIVGMIK